MEAVEKQEIPSVWVDWENRVISFSSAEGFEELRFSPNQEKFQFVFAKGTDGFGIQ